MLLVSHLMYLILNNVVNRGMIGISPETGGRKFEKINKKIHEKGNLFNVFLSNQTIFPEINTSAWHFCKTSSPIFLEYVIFPKIKYHLQISLLKLS